MFLITESPTYAEVLFEEFEGKKKLYLEGIFGTSENINRNGRIYTEAVLSREFENFTNERINTKTAWGELEHPQSASINPDRVSHLIVSMVKEGNDHIGKAAVLSDGKGALIRSMVEVGGQVGVSTRGVGSLTEKDGVKHVNENFRLVTVDAVLNPSNQTSFVNGILENVEFVFENGILVSKDVSEEEKNDIEQEIEDIKTDVHSAKGKSLTEAKIKAMNDFMNLIKKI